MRILVSNDDGIEAEGLQELVSALKTFCDVTVVAPRYQQSGVATAISLRDPLFVKASKQFEGVPAWTVEGTPADCIKLAMSVILDFRPDMIISGINKGSNAGRNLLYSGTVGATIEGAMRGIPGIAFSCSDIYSPDYGTITPYVESIVRYFFEHPIPSGTVINVNSPWCKADEVRGVRMASQGYGYWSEDPVAIHHPLGTTAYWLGGKVQQYEEAPHSDISLLKENFVTAVPANVSELTHVKHLEENSDRFATYIKRYLP